MTGFPWNSLGNVAAAFDGLGQIAAYVGIWGLTFLVALWTLAPARLAEPASASARFLLLIIAGSALMLWGLGAWRLSQRTTKLRAQRDAAHRPAEHPAKR